MGVPYTVRFTARRYFENEETEWTDESALESFSELLHMFHDVSMDIAEPRDECGRVLGYDAVVQVEYHGEAELPDRFYPGSDDAIALALLADFREKADEGLAEIEQIDQITVEFTSTEHFGPVQFALSRRDRPTA